jgi:hypothetical protein
MTQLALNTAPAKRFSKGPYATTTARFNDSGDWSATAWQGPVERGSEPRKRRGAVAGWLASPAASTAFIGFMLPIEATGVEPEPVANLLADSAEQVSAVADSVDASIPEEGVYAPQRPRKVLLSEVVEFRTDKLPRRKPHIAGDGSFLVVIDDE